MNEKKRWKVGLKRVTARAAAVLLCLCALGGCSGTNKDSDEKALRIVTSFYPLYIMMINLTDGVDSVEVANMAEPQTGCLHDYQLRPKDLVCLDGADIFVANGGGMEEFLSDVLEAYPDLTIVYAMDALEDEELLPGGEEDEGGNPHTWMDMKFYKEELRYLEKMLADLDSVHEEKYQKNREIYEDKIDDLAAEYEDLKEKEDKSGCILLHESFAYLAEEFDFPVVDILDVEKDSGFSAKELRELVDAVGEDGAGSILSDSQYSGQIAGLLSEETGLPVYSLDSGVSGTYEKDAYLNSMKNNLEELRNATN